jgi:hypothetical protein
MEMTDRPRVYDGEGDRLVQDVGQADRIVTLPDTRPSKVPDRAPKIRLQWGQHLLEDLLAGRYRSLVCGVNAQDNSGGIITQLAQLLPTSQWDQHTITQHAARFATPGGGVKVLKIDMDAVEVLAILRPTAQEQLTLDDLAAAFNVIAEMIRRDSDRLPSASVSFLGARSNRLTDSRGREPSLESVLRVMHEAGYSGDVYPAPAMWAAAPTAVYARYPFPQSVDEMRNGGF